MGWCIKMKIVKHRMSNVYQLSWTCFPFFSFYYSQLYFFKAWSTSSVEQIWQSFLGVGRAITLWLWRLCVKVSWRRHKSNTNCKEKLRYKAIFAIQIYYAFTDISMIRLRYHSLFLSVDYVLVNIFYKALIEFSNAVVRLFSCRICSQRWTLQRIAEMQTLQWKTCCYGK